MWRDLGRDGSPVNFEKLAHGSTSALSDNAQKDAKFLRDTAKKFGSPTGTPMLSRTVLKRALHGRNYDDQ